jgi:hypothetical protein
MPQQPDEKSIASSLKQWIEINISQFLSGLDLPHDESWGIPVVEDYVLVVAVKDYKDGGVGVFTLSDASSANYRIRGLLETAIDN